MKIILREDIGDDRWMELATIAGNRADAIMQGSRLPINHKSETDYLLSLDANAQREESIGRQIGRCHSEVEELMHPEAFAA